MPNQGEIQVILGPMFSGKSTELMRRIERYRIAKHDCMLIKPVKDVRSEKKSVSTHDGKKLGAVTAEKLYDVYDKIPPDCSVVGIDEGQFFPDIIEFSEEMADKGIRVIIAALAGDYKREAFGKVLDLIPLAESVVKLTAVCMVCFGEASFSKRRGSETEIELIGGTDKYMAVCRKCYKGNLPEQTSGCLTPRL